MEVLIEKFGWWQGYSISVITVLLRYALFAGVAFLFFYILFKDNWLPRKIQQKFPDTSHLWSEIKHSTVSAAVFALIGLLLHVLRTQGWTQIYMDFSSYSWGYAGFSLVALIVLHDTYFYWVHRLMHHPRLFMLMHATHHKSRNPTPWAALAFHPLEAMLEIAIVPLLAFFMPFHPLTLFVFATWSLAWNVLGHSGFEVFPKGFVKHPIFKWFNTSTHHNMHHHRSGCNYGLYFNFWDRVMGTNHKAYEATFEAVTDDLATKNSLLRRGKTVVETSS